MSKENKTAITVYLVTSGEYSDYSVNGAFSTREKAQAYIDHREKQDGPASYRRDIYDIEEWQLDECVDEIARGLSCYSVSFQDITKGDARAWPASPTPNDEGQTYPAPRYISAAQPEQYTVHVWAKSEEAALKIGNERRAKFLAEREGIGA